MLRRRSPFSGTARHRRDTRSSAVREVPSSVRQAAREVLAHAAEAGYQEVFAYMDVDNYGYHAVCRRLGMVEVGVEDADTDRPNLVFVSRL